MADVKINVSKNGPYEVTGEAKLFDHQGAQLLQLGGSDGSATRESGVTHDKLAGMGQASLS